MGKFLIATVLAGGMLTSSAIRASAQSLTIDQLAGDNPNKRLVLEYLQMGFTEGKLKQARMKYFSPDFVNHPGGSMPPSKSGNLPPGLKVNYEFHEVIAEGDMVVVHSLIRGLGVGKPVLDPMGHVLGPKVADKVVDFFKVKDGKIVAKSDVVQGTPSEDVFFQ